tara:strand:- start:260 stop:922 length:663 start_codon:yes stop_codon:yes gene_type:complete
MPRTPPIKAVLFDLDGTLLNTLESLAGCFNRVLEAEGYPTHPVSAYRQFIGDGARKCVERCLPAPERTPEVITRILDRQQADYAKSWQQDVSLYPGMQSLLTSLRERGVPMAVLSNKDHQFVVDCVGYFFPAGTFSVVQGFDHDIPHKPDPAGARQLTRLLGEAPEHCTLIGDTAVDVQTAKNAGLTSIGVLWGFRDEQELASAGADYIVHKPEQLLDIL